MKKIIALILALVMLGSVSVFAADESVEVRETDDRWTATDVKEITAPKTELWLQVEADGQIDVTVPLVLVFKTNIDGGNATSPEAYQITNNSTADLVVTKIATAVEAKADNVNPMTLVAYDAELKEDDYKVKLSVNREGTEGIVIGTGAQDGWDLFKTLHENIAKNGGLFELKKAAADGTGKATRVYADMATGELSFVTKTDDNDVLDTTKGVKLLTVTYTVAIDTSDAIGDTITTNGASTVTNVTP